MDSNKTETLRKQEEGVDDNFPMWLKAMIVIVLSIVIILSIVTGA